MYSGLALSFCFIRACGSGVVLSRIGLSNAGGENNAGELCHKWETPITAAYPRASGSVVIYSCSNFSRTDGNDYHWWTRFCEISIKSGFKTTCVYIVTAPLLSQFLFPSWPRMMICWSLRYRFRNIFPKTTSHQPGGQHQPTCRVRVCTGQNKHWLWYPSRTVSRPWSYQWPPMTKYCWCTAGVHVDATCLNRFSVQWV